MSVYLFIKFKEADFFLSILMLSISKSSLNQMWKGQHLPSEAGKDKSYFAVHKTNTGSYFGMVATMDVYGYSPSDGQASVAAIWIGNDDGDNSDLDSIAVGWEVFPGQYGDSLTHFYTEWTRDAYRSTGCHNMKCPGFQRVSGSEIAPGAVIQPVSDVNGSQQKITIKVLKDPSTGDWWIHYGFNGPPKPVGFYPANLFDTLNKKATVIAFGGAVNVVTSHTTHGQWILSFRRSCNTE
ncbi:hypothetical protein PVAP13_8KG382300 [Panicum virgatum]|uniref:Neprosin PEP catalytic domain-containing protein n=1 Tax=Panicum virgatum TaxID=38727 RepID=A0A8T0PQ39_PANVG|nr:hypothetical protein PVAP13_8KG382300 [Panicum virgatum]